MENKGGNAKNEIGIRVWKISMGMWGIWVEMQNLSIYWKLSMNYTKFKKNLFGMETTQKLNTLPYVTHMKMVA